MSERTLTITVEQSDYLAALGAEAQKTQGMFNAALTAVLRGHGVKELLALTKLDGTTLVVEVPE